MKEEKKSASGKGVGGIFFFGGFILALIFGWIVFPNLLFSEKAQPLNFSHVAHQDSTCDQCHSFNPDGTYSGIPRLDNCVECHESPMTSEESERILVEEYIQKQQEIPWKVYAWQPDNVFFSHAPHQAKNIECTRCHRDVSKEAKLPPYSENRLTGYSKSTMKMIDCEKCHAQMGANNNCQVCHK
jgi:hypothetical protein